MASENLSKMMVQLSENMFVSIIRDFLKKKMKSGLIVNLILVDLALIANAKIIKFTAK